jgi:hypothetical protein
MFFTQRSSPFDYFQERARMPDYSPKHEHKFTLGLWTVGHAERALLKYERLDQLTIDLLLGAC